MNSIFTIAGIGIVSTAFVIILKQYRPEFAFGAALAAVGIVPVLDLLQLVALLAQQVAAEGGG